MKGELAFGIGWGQNRSEKVDACRENYHAKHLFVLSLMVFMACWSEEQPADLTQPDAGTETSEPVGVRNQRLTLMHLNRHVQCGEPISPAPAEVEEVQEVEIESSEPSSSPAVVKKALFRKGELTDYGTTQLLPRQDFAGVGFGLSEMDGYRYLAITPDFKAIRGNAALGAGFPLRLQMDDLISGGDGNFMSDQRIGMS